MRVVDVRWYLGAPSRGRDEYDTSHVPGAIFLDLDRDLSAPEGDGRHPLPDAQSFAETVGAVGIGNDNHVIVYDDAAGGVAARLWWMLHHFGHPAVSVLDGGFAAWTAAEYPVTAAVHTYEPEQFVATTRSDDLIDRDELRKRLGSVLLLDTRAPNRYEGIEEPIDPVAGHIPTALSAPYTDNVTDDGRFLDPKRLANRFHDLGVAEGHEIVAYCGSGTTACQALLAMELAGLPSGKLYPGSWSDWSTAGYPVATGSDPGDPPP